MIPTETGRAGDSQPAWPWASPCALPRFYPFKDVFICGEVRSRATSLPLIHFPTKGWNSPGVEARGLPSPPGAGQELRGLATIWGSLIYFFFSQRLQRGRTKPSHTGLETKPLPSKHKPEDFVQPSHAAPAPFPYR